MMDCGRGIPDGRDCNNAQGSRPPQVASSCLTVCTFWNRFCIKKWPVTSTSQVRSSYRPLGGARRDPGLVWSRATMTIENIRERSSVIRQFVTLSFVVLRPPLPAVFNGSLQAESSKRIYSTVHVKVRQVCLETIYCGCDVAAIIPTGFMESRS